MVRSTPKLDLTPELTEPNSEDFNLFYRYQINKNNYQKV